MTLKNNIPKKSNRAIKLPLLLKQLIEKKFMEGSKILKDSQIIILGVCIAGATIVASLILSGGFLKIMKFWQHTITVKGSAQEIIKSDYIVWDCTFTRREASLQIAYKELKGDLGNILAYMTSKEVNKNDEHINQIDTKRVYQKDNDGNDTSVISGYELSQSIEIRSKDIDKIDALAHQSTELIDQGINFESVTPNYFYNNIDALKVELLAKATENAKSRAESIVNSVGNKIGSLQSAKMGVFQITPITSTQVSDYGEDDTNSLEKKVMVVVNASFAIE